MHKNPRYMSVFYEDEETRRNCSRLVYAVETANHIQIRKLLSQTPELVHMEYGPDKQVPLERAIASGKVDVGSCEILLQFGADVTYENSITNDSLLHLAARQSHVNIIEMLINLGAPLDGKNTDGMTPLMECVANEDLEGSTLLLTAGADCTEVRSKTGFNAVHFAISECKDSYEVLTERALTLCKSLITFTATQSVEALDNFTPDRETPLLTAIRNGNFTVAKWLLESGASPNIKDKHNYSPLCLLLHVYHDFVKEKSKKNKEKKSEKVREMIGDYLIVSADELIDCLIEHGADLTPANNRGETALHFAIANNLLETSLKIARSLQNMEAVLRQLNMDGYSVLHLLARGHHDQKFTLQVLQLIFKKDVPREVIEVRAKDDSTALFNAILCKKLDVARYLVEKGADVKCICNQETLLHAACRSRKIELVTYALKQGIDVNAVNRDFYSAAHLAAVCCPRSAMAALIDAGADVNLPNKPDGYSPFYTAVRFENSEVLDVMLPKANLEQLTTYGETAMAEAARQGKLQVVSSLIAACANQRTAEGRRFIDLYSTRGKPPLVAAAERGHRQVVDVLLRNGADPNLVILDGTTALYAAIGQGQIATVRMLLAWGADLTAVDRCGPRLCCFSCVDKHPHLEMSPLFGAAKFQNLNLAKLCLKFYQSPPTAVIRDIVTVFSSAAEEDVDSRWSPMFIATFVEFLQDILAKPPPLLQHQCRMKIRTLLGSPFPLRLAFLNCPIEIKEYLMMKKELSEGADEDPVLPTPPPPQ